MKHVLSAVFTGVVSLVLLVSCGGGGGGSAPDTTPPTIVSTDPAVRASSGQTRAVNVTFSEAIASATVSAATLTVSRGGTALVGTWSASGSVASFTPQENLCFFSLHSATVTTGIKDLAGNALVSGLTWTFTTGDGTWDSSLVSVDTSTTHLVSAPDIGMDSNGNAVAVWLQDNGGGIGEVWASRYVPGTGWSAPVQLDSKTNTASRTGMDPPKVAVNGNGNAVAVWNERNDVGGSTIRGNIWGSRYSATTGLWSAASLLETDNTWEAGKPQTGIDDAGNAVAVWIQEATGDTAFRVYTSLSSAGTATWTAPAGNTLNPSWGAGNPSLAMNGTGQAIVAWSGLDTVGFRVMAGQVTGGTWSGQTIIDAVTTDGGNYGPTPSAAINSTGTAFVVWDQVIDGGSEMDVWANIYSSGTWTSALQIRNAASGSGQGRHAQVSVDPAGNAIVVWDEANVASEILARRYAAGTGWDANPTTLDDTAKGNDMNPQIALDPSGNAIVLWSDQGRAYAKRYRAGAGWGTTIATLEANSNAAYTDVAALAVHGTCGNAIAIWPGDRNFNFGIQTSRFR